MELKDLSKDERSLLLFLETQAVDYCGAVDATHMNKEDFDIAKKWKEEGFIKFGRIYSEDLNTTIVFKHLGTHWVELSDQAWEFAHQERKARSDRMTKVRKWRKTEEKDIL